jgi:nucleoside-triphosphatase THEP1
MRKRPLLPANQDRLILWVGEKHSGKTTSAADLVRIVRAGGFEVAGVLAPSLYSKGRLMGFDVLDLRNQTQAPLARRRVDASETGPFRFIEDGLRLGAAALSPEAAESADLVIVDEFGPLELSGRGWRSSVDSLLASINAAILLVVRRELVESVHHVYADFWCWNVDATEPESCRKIIGILDGRRRSMQGAT